MKLLEEFWYGNIEPTEYDTNACKEYKEALRLITRNEERLQATICNKDYSEFVDIVRYKDKNPDKRDRNKFTKAEIKRLWELAEDPFYQIVLMLIYNGCRISEFLDLKKEDVHLEEQYFDVIASKTENGLRKVPIADKVLPFYKAWYEGSKCEYLLHTPDQKHFDYRNYYDSYFTPPDGADRLQPHAPRHQTHLHLHADRSACGSDHD